MKGADRYPLALAALARLAASSPASSPVSSASSATQSVAPFTVGSAVFRPPPAVARPVEVPNALPDALEEGGPSSTDAMLGELVDMVFVSAEENHGQHEVHLVFKAEVLGGLHLKLVKKSDGMHATFVVEDAAARRAVIDHVEQLVAHLKTRGFHIVAHAIEVAL